MPIKKENILEKIKRLEEESQTIYYQERKDREDREKDIRLKELEKDIAEKRIAGDVQKVRVTYKWRLIGDIFKRLITLPLLLLLFPFIGFALIKGRPLPKWFEQLL
jgi:hypothetical protein